DQLREHAIAVAAGEGERELREEEAVWRADVEATAGDGERQITSTRRERVQRRRETERAIGRGVLLLIEQREDLRLEHVHAEEAEIETCARAWHDELLFGDRGRGFFEHGFDLIQRPRAADAPAADRAKRRELALAR